MSDLNVTERRLRPILDAVALGNWKQALQQCDKWQKKGEKSDRFLALKASILVNQPDKNQFEKGKSETLQLCQRTPAVTDIEALYQLQGSLKHLSLHREEGHKLWERAIAARPNDKELLSALLNGSFSDGNWMSAQKAAMALRKAYPQDRQYEFWNILLCYLINQEDSLPQKERDLFGRLAYMLMSKSAESTPVDQAGMTATIKAVSTPEELLLLVKIYIATDHADQAVNLLQSPSLGLKSRIASLDPQLSFSLFLEVLSMSKDLDNVLDTCQRLIRSGSPIAAQHAEDDRVWKILRAATKGDDSRAKVDICRRFAQSVYQEMPACRPAYLTLFDFAFEEQVRHHKSEDIDIIDVCKAYFDQFSQKPFCFGDLVRLLLSDRSSLDSFISLAQPQNGNDLQQAFALKLEHACVGTAKPDSTNVDYLKVATKAIKLHKRLPKEKSECPEMILLAATSLLRLALNTSNDSYGLQANYMLDNCYARFNEYYPVAIRQVQIFLTRGQISLAMAKFASLAVKNLQWETVGHLLLNRISTLHPWQSGVHTESGNPLAALDAGLTMLISADQSLDKAIQAGLTYGSYSNIIDAVNVKNNMNRSTNRQVFIVEERRIQRTVGVPQDVPLDPCPAEMVDQRDFSFLPDLGCFSGQEELEASLCCGPLPRRLWLMAMGLHDHLATFLKAQLASHATLAGSAYKRLETMLQKCAQRDDDWDSELTPAERSSFRCEQLLSEALLLFQSSPPSKQDEFDELMGKVKTWLDRIISPAEPVGIANLNGVDTPTWNFIHTCHTRLATIQNISLFLSLQARRAKSPKPGKAVALAATDTLKELQKQVGDAESSIHTSAKRLRDGINAPGVLGRLVDAVAGRVEDTADASERDACKALAEEYADFLDEAALEEYCGSMKESWEDALDGIIRVKIKAVK